MSEFSIPRPDNLEIASRINFPWGSIAVSREVEAVYGIMPRDDFVPSDRIAHPEWFKPVDVVFGTGQEYDFAVPSGGLLAAMPDADDGKRWPVDVVMSSTPAGVPGEERVAFGAGRAGLGLALQQNLPDLVEGRARKRIVDGSRRTMIAFLGGSLGLLALEALTNNGEISQSAGVVSFLGLVAGVIVSHVSHAKSVTWFQEGREHREDFSAGLATVIANDFSAAFRAEPRLGGSGTRGYVV